MTSASTVERVQDWIWRHKLLLGVVVLASGTIAYRAYRRSRYCHKTRRARRARSGGRIEVVVIAGSPTLPLTRSLALDLERKGFVVYIVSNSVEDEVMVQALSRPDIRPLTIDITDVSFLSLSTLPTFSLSADWSDAETKSPLAQAPLSRGLPTICSHRTRPSPV